MTFFRCLMKELKNLKKKWKCVLPSGKHNLVCPRGKVDYVCTECGYREYISPD